MGSTDADRVIAVLTERIDKLRGDFNDVKVDHEARLRVLEANMPDDATTRLANLETAEQQRVGGWKVLTAGGFLGGTLVALSAAVARSLGL